MANNMFRVRYVVVFQNDGLNAEGVINDINKEYGTVFDQEEKALDEETPVTLMYIDGSLSQYISFKFAYNCVEPRKYVLFPMASREDKKLVEAEWKNN